MFRYGFLSATPVFFSPPSAQRWGRGRGWGCLAELSAKGAIARPPHPRPLPATRFARRGEIGAPLRKTGGPVPRPVESLEFPPDPGPVSPQAGRGRSGPLLSRLGVARQFCRASWSLVRRAEGSGHAPSQDGRGSSRSSGYRSRSARHPARQDIGRGRGTAASLESGCSITTTMFAKDTSHKTCFRCSPPAAVSGCGDRFGPASFRVLPWSPATVLLCNSVLSANRRPVHSRPASTGRCSIIGGAYDFVAGLEVEFHIFKLEEIQKCRRSMRDSRARPPDVSLLSRGYQYLTEQRYDQMEPVLEIIRRDILLALGLPLRSIEVEFGPSQCEFTFAPIEPADTMILFRSAGADRPSPRLSRHLHVRRTLHLRLSRLHQSIVARGLRRERVHDQGRRQAVRPSGGIIESMPARPPCSRRRVNGYKRYRSYSLAPDRAIWGRDNRGVMVRVLGGPDDGPRWKTASASPPPSPMASEFCRASTASTARSIRPSADTPYETRAVPLPKARGGVRAEGRSVLPRCVRPGLRRLLHPRQKRRDQTFPTKKYRTGEQREYFEMF